MSREEARRAFGKRGYGEDTSASRRNGAIGVGAKDAFYGMVNVDIITIKDRIPTLIHEQNAVLGRANRLLAPRVEGIATSFQTTEKISPKTKHKMTSIYSVFKIC